MKHGILGLLIFFLASIPVGMHAQKSQSSYSVKGVLVDSLSNEGEPYATIRISLSESPTKPVRLAQGRGAGVDDQNVHWNLPPKNNVFIFVFMWYDNHICYYSIIFPWNSQVLFGKFFQKGG